eukprot:SAG31_NODE_4684_length_3034_cov_1.497445_1_plen_385_part_00
MQSCFAVDPRAARAPVARVRIQRPRRTSEGLCVATDMEIAHRLKAQIPRARFEEFERANDGSSEAGVNMFEFTRWLAHASTSCSVDPLSTAEVDQLCHLLDPALAGLVDMQKFHSAFTSKFADFTQPPPAPPADSDGMATAENVRDLALALCDADAFGHIDMDGDGMLSPWELQLWLTKLGVSVPDALFKSITTSFDQNSDGRLDIHEFQQLAEVLRDNARLANVPSARFVSEEVDESVLSVAYAQRIHRRVEAAASEPVDPKEQQSQSQEPQVPQHLNSASPQPVAPDFLRRVAQALPIEAFDELDVNADGFISEFEMASFLARNGLEMDEDGFAGFWAVADADDDGRVSLLEFRELSRLLTEISGLESDLLGTGAVASESLA